MIKRIVIQAAQKHDFELIDTLPPHQPADDQNHLTFLHQAPIYMLQHKGESKRFLAIVECKEIASPQQLNDMVLQHAPLSFKSDPAFDKNTDLVILYNLEFRADFSKIENSVFIIEENPYYFKKYFLYYSKEESNLLSDVNFETLSNTITDEDKFSDYRDNPLTPTLYSIAARIFIKLPFVKVPVKESALKPLSVYINEAVREAKLETLYHAITQTENSSTPEQLAEILLNEEMENFKA